MTGSFVVFVLLSCVMGATIYLSFPLLMRRTLTGRTAVFLQAVAIGILAFLMADIYGDVAGLISAGATAYLTVPSLDAVFAAAVVVSFLVLWSIDLRPSAGGEPSARRTATIIALGMGFQNLTEGLVFGASWSAGLVGLETVVFVGFVLQNFTEGFPIAAPFFGRGDRAPMRLLGVLFLIGAIPTPIGAVVGYFLPSTPLELLFDGAAIGAIVYVLLPMIRAAFRPLATTELTAARNRWIYTGVLVGFIVGFLVNAF